MNRGRCAVRVRDDGRGPRQSAQRGTSYGGVSHRERHIRERNTENVQQGKCSLVPYGKVICPLFWHDKHRTSMSEEHSTPVLIPTTTIWTCGSCPLVHQRAPLTFLRPLALL